MNELTATQAAHIAKINPWDEVKERRNDLMEGIEFYANKGQQCFSRVCAHADILQEDVNWLVSLGYMVFKHKPFWYKKDSKPQYSYSIYWTGDSTWDTPFAPGERFSSDYNDEPDWKKNEPI